MIIFFHPDAKLHTPEEVDGLLSAEFPDEEEHPELFELVKSVMVHTSCESEYNNPNASCIKKEKCTKNFPKLFQDQTVVTTDSYAKLRR